MPWNLQFLLSIELYLGINSPFWAYQFRMQVSFLTKTIWIHLIKNSFEWNLFKISKCISTWIDNVCLCEKSLKISALQFNWLWILVKILMCIPQGAAISIKL